MVQFDSIIVKPDYIRRFKDYDPANDTTPMDSEASRLLDRLMFDPNDPHHTNCVHGRTILNFSIEGSS